MKNLIDWFMYDFITGIKNLIYWFPIIWKDRDFDFHYTYQILKEKLKKQANYLSIKGRHVNVDYDVRNINICIKLIEKLQNEYYEHEYSDYHSINFKFIPLPNSSYSELKIEHVWENYDDYLKKYPLVHKRILKGEGRISIQGREDDKEFVSMCIGRYNQDRAKKLLYKIFENQMDSWWD